MEIGPRARAQLDRFGHLWRQGQHVLTTGPTGGGKTTLARQLMQKRIERGGYTVVFVAKLQRDRTLDSDYKGFKRWPTWRNPRLGDNKILLWPDISKIKTIPDARKHQREVFMNALDAISRRGSQTVVLDEGMYMTDSEFMNLSERIGMLFQLGRSADISMMINALRPSHLPVVIYGSVSHAFIGRAVEDADVKRLVNMGTREDSDELRERLKAQAFYEFTWIPARNDLRAESLRLDR